MITPNYSKPQQEKNIKVITYKQETKFKEGSSHGLYMFSFSLEKHKKLKSKALDNREMKK